MAFFNVVAVVIVAYLAFVTSAVVLLSTCIQVVFIVAVVVSDAIKVSV